MPWCAASWPPPPHRHHLGFRPLHDDIRQLFHGRLLWIAQQMGVSLRRARLAVPQDGADERQRRAVADQKTGGTVAQIVDTEIPKIGGPAYSGPRLLDFRQVIGAAARKQKFAVRG